MLLKSGFVENVEDNKENELYFIRAHVHHSMKNEKPLLVSTTISNLSGYVKGASCDCRASAIERCAHVSALLLMLSDYVKENGCNVVIPSTSLPCEWNKGQKRKKIQNLFMRLNMTLQKVKIPNYITGIHGNQSIETKLI